MGKRKRTGQTSAHPPSDSTPCSSGRDLTPGENSSDPDDSGVFKAHPAINETMDGHGKHSNSQLSLGQHHHNLSRSMFLKRSRHHYGNQYSRRNSSNHHKPSSSYGKNSPFHDERLCFKLGSRHNSESAHRSDLTEFRERAFWLPERITSSSVDIVSPEGVKTICGICQKVFRWKPQHFGSEAEDIAIVAVLVCGHVYHAHCLERKTPHEDKRDPPCPICTELIRKAEPA